MKMKILNTTTLTDTTTVGLVGGHLDRVLEASADTQASMSMSEPVYSLLKRRINKLVGKRVELVNDEGEERGLLVLNADAGSRGKTKVAELHSKFFLNWEYAENLPAGKFRGLRVSLVASGNQWFLNLSFSPVKFLSGQNVCPVAGPKWIRYPLVHTPAGYMRFAFNMLAFFCKRQGLDLAKHGVTASELRWHEAHVAENVQCGTAEGRDAVLTTMLKAWDWKWWDTSEGKTKQRSLESMFGIKVQTYLPEERSTGMEDDPPSVLLSRMLVVSNDAGSRITVCPYKISFYPKDVELRNKKADVREVDTAVLKGLETGLRVEFRLSPYLFQLKAVRKFLLTPQAPFKGQRGEDGDLMTPDERVAWLDEEDLAEPRSLATLNKLFPTQQALLERWPLLAQVLWQECCLPVLLNPPTTLQIRMWAEAQDLTLKYLVGLWLASVDAPLAAAQKGYNSGSFDKTKGTARRFQEAYQDFRAQWGFSLSDLSPAALAMLSNAIDRAHLEDGVRLKLEMMQEQSKSLYLADMSAEAADVDRSRAAVEAEAFKKARAKAAAFRPVLQALQPNAAPALPVTKTKRKARS